MTNKTVTELLTPPMTDQEYNTWVENYDGRSEIPEVVHAHVLFLLKKMNADLDKTINLVNSML